jgi:hypothetical protein
LKAPDGRSFGRRAKIVSRLEQGGLLQLRRLPWLKLFPAQFAEALQLKAWPLTMRMTDFAMTHASAQAASA